MTVATRLTPAADETQTRSVAGKGGTKEMSKLARIGVVLLLVAGGCFGSSDSGSPQNGEPGKTEEDEWVRGLSTASWACKDFDHPFGSGSIEQCVCSLGPFQPGYHDRGECFIDDCCLVDRAAPNNGLPLKCECLSSWLVSDLGSTCEREAASPNGDFVRVDACPPTTIIR